MPVVAPCGCMKLFLVHLVVRWTQNIFSTFFGEVQKRRLRRLTNYVSVRVFASMPDVELAESDCQVKASVVEFNWTQIRGIWFRSWKQAYVAYVAHTEAAVLPQNRSDMGNGNAYAGRMLDRMQGSLKREETSKNSFRSWKESYEAYVGWRPDPSRHPEKGVSPEAFLVLIVVSSAELTDLKPKEFGRFSEIHTSWSLFWRVVAGCAIAHKAKEKPLEHCVIPTV